MVSRLATAALTSLILTLPGGAAALAQQSGAPVPLLPTSPQPSEPEPLPPSGPGMRNPAAPSREADSPPGWPGPGAAPAAEPAAARVFCRQAVTVRLANREDVPERFRRFIGVWSDASWTPQLCAALVVENVAPDGTATITYAFGPMGSDTRGPGAVLNGTGIVRDGELRFQNSDGSQFAFRGLYADLDGHLTTPQGQSYHAIFKKTP